MAVSIGFVFWFKLNDFDITKDTTMNPNNEFFAVITLFLVLIPFALFWVLGYFILFEKVFNATSGKYLLGLQVADESGIKTDWLQAIIRNLTKI